LTRTPDYESGELPRDGPRKAVHIEERLGPSRGPHAEGYRAASSREVWQKDQHPRNGERPWPKGERPSRQDERPWPTGERRSRQGEPPWPTADRPRRPPTETPAWRDDNLLWPGDGRLPRHREILAPVDRPPPTDIAASRGRHHRRTGQTAPQPTLQRAHLSSGVRPLTLVVLALCQLVGTGALVRSYQIAETVLTTPSEFAWFWLGMFLLTVPTIVVIMRQATSPAMRTALLILYGFATYAPKLLRSPTGPVYHDEYAHWLATYNILHTGELFRSNAVIPIISRFPGLHVTTATLVQATGLTIWQAGTVVLLLCHVILLLGIGVLVRRLGMSSRTASLAAVIYSLNSSFLYFDTQYAYESIAITMVVWALVAFVGAIRSRPGQERIAWSALTGLLSTGTIITHHLSTFTLVVIMAVISLATSVPWLARTEGWVRTALSAWSLTLFTALTAGAWFHFVAPQTLSYLSPFLGQGFSELMQAAGGSGAARHLFGASLSPWWEQKGAYLTPVLALCLAIGGLFLMRARLMDGRLPRGRRRAIFVAFALFGLVYFPSTVFILAPSGAEGARRSWAFTWIGLSVLAAPAAVWLLDWVTQYWRRWSRITLRLGLTGVLFIALVGGTAAGVDASYRFPGPFLYGSDARSATPELVAASAWFRARLGVGNRIVTDRYTGLVFASFGLQKIASASANFPIWGLYLAKPGQPIVPAYLIYDLALSHYTYLVVDERMAYEVPEIGVYFTSNDPASAQPQHGRSPFSNRLGKFDTIQWAVKVFEANNYAIYRLELPPGNVSYQSQPPTLRGQVLQGKLSVTP